MENTIALIRSISRAGSHLGLERVEKLLHLLGDPQKDLRFIHVAGTNGKGSVSAMLASILRCAGYSVGLYTSPHLTSYRERIRVNGADISESGMHSLALEVKRAAESMEDKVTEFELLTAIALLYFARKRCDIVVLEVGLGGRLDATNVISTPEVAVLMNISLDHTEILGDALDKIAREKAGIIKRGGAVVAYPSSREAEGVFKAVCADRQAPLQVARFEDISVLSEALDGQRFDWHRYSDLEIPLLGRHQINNAVMALEAVEVLRGKKDWKIPEDAVRRGLASVRWAARQEVLNASPAFILDGGHNSQCALALADSLRTHFPGKKAVFLIGVLADKDYGEMIRQVAPCAAGFFCLTPDSGRALPADELAAFLRENGQKAEVCADVESGVAEALSAAGNEGIVVAFGSLYLAGEVRAAYPAAFKKWRRGEGIRAREGLSQMLRETYSRVIVQRIMDSPEFKRAKTVMLYRAKRGEVNLDALITMPESAGKRLVFPRCAENGELLALFPKEGAWLPGPYGIQEPVPSKSVRIPPEELDMVICPCAAFDESGNRLGMGAGYYDRFLPLCKNADVSLVAFEAQKAAHIPGEAWDYPIELMFTESAVYRAGGTGGSGG